MNDRLQSLRKDKDGLLIAEIDLNLCRRANDEWGFRMTQRIPFYADSLSKASKPNYKPQLISK